MRQRISAKVAQAYVDGRLNQFPFNSGWYVSERFGKTFFYRSSYELRVVKIMEADAAVVDLDYEPFKVRIVVDGVVRHTVPDFLVKMTNGESFVIEVKPQKMTLVPKVAAKLDATRMYFEGQGVGYEVWTEREISTRDGLPFG